MPRQDINQYPFDEGTLTKLEIFQLYVREWLPVFLARQEIIWPQVHLFDFFCGSGSDSKGISGSAIRILEELAINPDWLARRDVRTSVHLSDANPEKIDALKVQIVARSLNLANLTLSVGASDFSDALDQAKPILKSPNTACLVFLDQYGIKDVSEEVFRFLVACPQTDILFFISSAIFSRMGDHPSIRRYHDLGKPEDSYEAHRAVVKYFRDLLPPDSEYYLASFSIKKGSNVYGLVFGSGHPLGIEKFLHVAWRKDSLNGEANFDINRDGLSVRQYMLFNERPTKVTAFEADLKSGISNHKLATEADIYRFCILSGMTPTHAKPVIQELKREGRLSCDWLVPNIKSLKQPRPMRVN